MGRLFDLHGILLAVADLPIGREPVTHAATADVARSYGTHIVLTAGLDVRVKRLARRRQRVRLFACRVARCLHLLLGWWSRRYGNGRWLWTLGSRLRGLRRSGLGGGRGDRRGLLTIADRGGDQKSRKTAWHKRSHLRGLHGKPLPANGRSFNPIDVVCAFSSADRHRDLHQVEYNVPSLDASCAPLCTSSMPDCVWSRLFSVSSCTGTQVSVRLVNGSFAMDFR